MSSFFGKLKSGTGPTSPSIGSPSSKKDPNAPPPTPSRSCFRMQAQYEMMAATNSLEWKIYCNSILQCLYYSAPFRENVLSYPTRSTPEALKAAATTAVPRAAVNPQAANGAGKKPVITPINRNASTTPNQSQKAEDKDSPEYKKKQALLAGPILNMSYQNAAGYDMPESLYTSLKDIFEAAVLNQSRTGVISPSKLLEVLRKENEMFRSAMHQDAHEFLNLLLNAVVEEIEKHERRTQAEKDQEEKEPEQNGTAVKQESAAISFPSLLPVGNGQSKPGWLHGLFEGTLTSETRCLTCENTSQRDEPFLDLSVDLEQHSSVTSCLRRFSEEEMLCERNKFHCDNCGGLQEAEKRMKIKRLPRILALHLKRFKYTEDLQRLQKLFHKVVYPYHLRLFNTTDDAEDPDRLYELYAVVVHIGGGPYHGHYVAIIKTQDRGWLLFDDEMVEPVERSFIRNFFGDRPGLACAYVLFYQETTFEAMQRDQKMEGRRVPQDVPIGLGLQRAKESAELHRVQSFNPPLSPTSTHKFANLDHAFTAPTFPPNGHLDPPKSPLLGPIATTASSPIVQSKKEKAKEEKDRKTAEKEKEKAEKEKEKLEKQKRKETESKTKDVTKSEEEKKTLGDVTNKDPNQSNGANLSGLDRFRRTKSLKFGSLGKKDKPVGLGDESAITVVSPVEQTPEKDKEKKNRFSIRKKSFGMLS